MAGKKRKTYVLNYRVVVEPDVYAGTNKSGYTAYCSTLNVADGGGTIEEALKNIKGAIEATVEFLAEEGREIPVDKTEEQVVINTQVRVSDRPNLVFA